MDLKRAVSLLLSTALLSVIAFAGPVRSTRTQGDKAATIAKIGGFLKDSGYEYKQASESVWVINHKGKSVPNPQTLVIALEDFVIVGVVVAEKENIQVTADSMFKLLHLAHNMDYIKVGIDDDGDLFVRSEVRTRAMNSTEFKDTVERVFSAADRAYTEIKPFLNKP
jgi:hypothetical protein